MVPTLGDYFRAAGYRTHYRGKWHISHEDILVPGTHNALLSNTTDGKSIVENTAIYRRANRLDKYGFDGWIGPEPHGSSEANCGWRRDPLYAREALELLDRLDGDGDAGDEPWLLVNSYVNPHDIVFFKETGPRLHHMAFTSPESHNILHACDVAGTLSAPATVNLSCRITGGDTAQASEENFNAIKVGSITNQ